VHAQVRVFSGRDHTRALKAGDVCAVVGWSGDLVQAAERSADIALVAPASGTALWADVWTVPAHAMHGSGVRQ
jgi:spermidine/putrescine-binding protein